MFTVEGISELVMEIRRENGFPDTPFRIDEIRYEEEGDKLFIIAHDRTDKSVIIGNSFVIGKLRESLGVRQVTVYSSLDLGIKRRKLERNAGRIKGTHLEFLLPVVEAEMKFPPRKWPAVKTDRKGLVFLSFNAKALLGFAESFCMEYIAVGIKHTFPRLPYEAVEGHPRELFHPDEGKLLELAEGTGAEIIMSDFPFDLKFADGTALLNPMRFFHIGFFELKYLFGFEKPVIYDKRSLIDFITALVYEGLMESTDGANLIWRMWRK
ncbi:hypothetical protein [Thermococcus sp.]|uniref:hypothetical protein n=1 Tax=Thermococcus sp. TaxID=35749 RepID=UPI002639A11B|nr:hypothetical protein [Thermococcus sp.]